MSVERRFYGDISQMNDVGMEILGILLKVKNNNNIEQFISSGKEDLKGLRTQRCVFNFFAASKVVCISYDAPHH